MCTIELRCFIQIGQENRLCTLYTTCKNPRGYVHVRRSGGLAPKFCLWNSCWSNKFCLQKLKWQIPQILPSEFQIWPQNWDLFPTFASCGDRTSQTFSTYLVNLVGPYPKFCLQTWWEVHAPPPPHWPTSLFGSTPWGKILTFELSGYRFKHQETIWIFLNTQNLKHLDLAEYSTKSRLWKYRLCQILWPLQNISQNSNNGNDIDFGNLEFAWCFEKIQV